MLPLPKSGGGGDSMVDDDHDDNQYPSKGIPTIVKRRNSRTGVDDMDWFLWVVISL